MSLKKLNILSVAVSLLFACGGMEQQDEPQISKEEYAFKHGPGPKAEDGSYSYYLTTFTGEKMACGSYAGGNWYYSTGEWMFYCGAKLKIQAANGKCVVVQVADNGPAAWVEAKAKAKCGGTGYILDVSPLVTKYLYGVSGAGWSDCKTRKVKAWKVSNSTKTGPTSCSGLPVDDGKNWIGESCGSSSDCSSKLTCNTQGHQDGMCTQSCSKYCPDRSGETTTFCVALDGANGQCYSQCNTSKYPSGCRSGYQCVNVPRYTEPGVKRDACIPDDQVSQALALGGDNGQWDTGNGSNIWIGGPCAQDGDCADSLMCNTKDHPDGMCTQQCPSNNLCPDRSGETTTFCVALDGVNGGYCYSRCDYNKFPSGCRQGYTCSKLPRNNQSWVKRNTCVPDSAAGKADFIGEAPDEEGDLPNPEDMIDQQGCSVGSRGALSGLPGLLLLLVICLAARRRRIG